MGDGEEGGSWEGDAELGVHRSLWSGRQPVGAQAAGRGCVKKL